MADETIQIILQGKDDFSATARRVNVEIDSLDRNAKRADVSHRSLGNTLGGLKTSLLAASGGAVAVGAALGVAVKQSMAWESSLDIIQANTGASAAQMAKLEAAVKSMGRQSGQSYTELATAMQHALNLGLNFAQAQELVKRSNEAAQITGAKLTDVVQAGGRAMGIFGIKASESQKTIDLLLASAQKGDLTFQQMTGALSTIGPAAHNAGVGLDETSAATAVLARTLPTEQVGTAFRAFLTSITNASPGAAKEIKHLADVTGIDLAQAFSPANLAKPHGLATALTALEKATGGNNKILRDILPNVRAYQGALGLLGVKTVQLRGITDSANSSLGHTHNLWKQNQGDLDIVMGKLQNYATDVELTIGNRVKTVLADLGTWFLQHRNDITSFFNRAGAAATQMWNDAQPAINHLKGSLGDLGTTISNLFTDIDKLIGHEDKAKGKADAWRGATFLLTAGLVGLATEIGYVADVIDGLLISIDAVMKSGFLTWLYNASHPFGTGGGVSSIPQPPGLGAPVRTSGTVRLGGPVRGDSGGASVSLGAPARTGGGGGGGGGPDYSPVISAVASLKDFGQAVNTASAAAKDAAKAHEKASAATDKHTITVQKNDTALWNLGNRLDTAGTAISQSGYDFKQAGLTVIAAGKAYDQQMRAFGGDVKSAGDAITHFAQKADLNTLASRFTVTGRAVELAGRKFDPLSIAIGDAGRGITGATITATTALKSFTSAVTYTARIQGQASESFRKLAEAIAQGDPPEKIARLAAKAEAAASAEDHLASSSEKAAQMIAFMTGKGYDLATVFSQIPTTIAGIFGIATGQGEGAAAGTTGPPGETGTKGPTAQRPGQSGSPGQPTTPSSPGVHTRVLTGYAADPNGGPPTPIWQWGYYTPDGQFIPDAVQPGQAAGAIGGGGSGGGGFAGNPAAQFPSTILMPGTVTSGGVLGKGQSTQPYTKTVTQWEWDDATQKAMQVTYQVTYAPDGSEINRKRLTPRTDLTNAEDQYPLTQANGQPWPAAANNPYPMGSADWVQFNARAGGGVLGAGGVGSATDSAAAIDPLQTTNDLLQQQLDEQKKQTDALMENNETLKRGFLDFARINNIDFDRVPGGAGLRDFLRGSSSLRLQARGAR